MLAFSKKPRRRRVDRRKAIGGIGWDFFSESTDTDTGSIIMAQRRERCDGGGGGEVVSSL